MEFVGSGGNQGAGDGGAMLHFPSPQNDNRFFDSHQLQHGRFGGGGPTRAQDLVDNFITIRVFLKVMEDNKNESLKTLFSQTLPNTDPNTQNLNQTSSITEHHVNYNGEDQVYIDVSNRRLSLIQF